MAKRLRKSDIGTIVLVKFQDHAGNTERPIYCEAVGWLLRYDKESLAIRSWVTPRDSDVDNSDADSAIVRSTITEIVRLEAQGKEPNG